MVFPFPGGPNSKRPRAGARSPVKSFKGEKKKEEKKNQLQEKSGNF